MTLSELIQELESIAEQVDANSTEVLLAVQPNWPLAHWISNVTEMVDPNDLIDCPCEHPQECPNCCGTGKLEPDDAKYVVWIAASEGHPEHMSIYAPKDAWQ